MFLIQLILHRRSILAIDAGGNSSSDIVVPVSAVPTLGSFSVSPAQGFGLSTKFTLSCADWFDDDLPLTYSFGYTVLGRGDTVVAVQDFKPQQTTDGVLLPAGVEEGNYVLSIVAYVRNGE